jgi:hypothetical protein
VHAVEQECLDHFAILGEGHRRYILAESVAPDSGQRPHPGMGNALLGRAPPLAAPGALSGSEVGCRVCLSGLLNHYTGRAA